MCLLGMFVAKCIQDGRRVDLPLSAPFFKLLCTPGGSTGGREDAGSSASSEMSRDSLESSSRLSTSSPSPNPTTSSPPPQQEAARNPQGGVVSDNDWESNRTSSGEQSLRGGGGSNSNQRSDSSLENEAKSGSDASQQRSRGEAGLKEAELLLVDEISKDGSPKASVVMEGAEGRAWFEGILKREDMEEVDPYRSRFLRQLRALCGRRDEIQLDQALSSLEKEQLLSGLTLPGSEENLPGPRVEDLW